jgi:hypothetical protein
LTILKPFTPESKSTSSYINFFFSVFLSIYGLNKFG